VPATRSSAAYRAGIGASRGGARMQCEFIEDGQDTLRAPGQPLNGLQRPGAISGIWFRDSRNEVHATSVAAGGSSILAVQVGLG
jgi:hypothetical protein